MVITTFVRSIDRSVVRLLLICPCRKESRRHEMYVLQNGGVVPLRCKILQHRIFYHNKAKITSFSPYRFPHCPLLIEM